MADTDPTGPVPPSKPATPPAPSSPATPPPPRRRRWLRVTLRVAVVAVVAGLALLAAAPTLLATRPVVNLVLAQVNRRLNGRVAVRSVSLGWTTGVKIDGLQVFDAANEQIAQADHVACPMPLWRAVTGSYPLGDTVVDGLAFDARYDAQGRLNFAQLVKTEPPTPTTAAPSTTAAAKPSKLPNLSGDLQVKNARGTVSQPGKPTVYLTAFAAEVKIPGTSEPITDHVDATLRVGDAGPVNKLSIDGTAAAVKANQLDLASANVHQKVDITSLDLAAAQPFVPATVGLDTLAGLLDVHLSLDLIDGKSAVVDGALTGTRRIVLGGQLLHGDIYATDAFAVAIPKLTASFPTGLADWQAGRVKVGADAGSAPVSFKVDQGQFTLVADVVPRAVMNLAASDAPGSAGRVAFADTVDAGRVVAQLKNTAHLSDGVSLTGGTLAQSLTLTLSPDRGTLTASTDLTGVTGTRTVDGKPQPVSIQPVHLKLAGTDAGTGKLLDSLRDLSLSLSSKSANADFHGSAVGDLTGTLTAQLQALQAEAAQLVDFGGAKLAGDVSIRLADTGQLMQAPYRATVKADVAVTNLQYADAAGPRVAEPLVQLSVTGDLQGSERAAVEQVRDLLVTIKVGTAAAPAVDVAMAVPQATLGATAAADFQLTRLNVDLPQLQRQLANVPPGQSGVVCTGGVLTGTAAGHYGPDGVRLDPSRLSLAGLFVQKQLTTGQRVAAISGETVNVSAAGTIGLGTATSVRLTDLSIADTAHILDLHKGDGELSLTKSADGIAGRGQLSVMVELASVADIARELSQEAATEPVPAGRLRSGHLAGTLAFTAAASGKTDVTGRFDVPNLDVATATGDAGPQHVAIVLRGSSDAAAHTVAIDEASLTSPFATAAVKGATLLLSAPSAVDQLQRATLAVDVPDLATLMAVAQSFSAPPAKGAPPPLKVTAGSFSMRADVSHDGANLALNVPTLTATKVAFTRGTATYAFAPSTAKLAAVLGTGAGQSLMAQLRGLKVTALDATTGVATVSMTTPITVADLSNPAASAAGGVKVDGELADLSPLLAALGGQPADAYPYRGHFTLSEDLTGGNGVALKGGVNVAHFQVMQGQAVQFAEDQLAVTNDVSMASDLNTAYLHAVTISMRSSGALDVAINNGSVTDLAKTRALNLPVQLKYDLAKLWPVIHPMLLTPGKPDAYADVKLAGAFTKSLRVGGSYPAGQPFEQAVKPLQLDADLAVADFEHGGLVVKDLDLPVTVRNGVAVTAFPDGHAAPVATANDGQLDLGQLSVDLTQTPPRLTTPAAKAVLTHATINPLFSQTFLAKVVNNPVFAGAKEATGLIDFTIDDCQRLPLGDLVTQPVAGNDGTAHVRFSLTSLHIGLEGLGQLASALKQDSFEANIKDGTVAVARGVSTQHVKFVTGSYTVAFDGNVRLADETFAPMTVGVPMAIILQKGGAASADVLRYVPDVVSVPLRGKVSSPQLDITSAAATTLRDAAFKAAGGLLGGQKGGNGNSAGDAIGGLLKGLGKKH
jgi:hypothetical protein